MIVKWCCKQTMSCSGHTAHEDGCCRWKCLCGHLNHKHFLKPKTYCKYIDAVSTTCRCKEFRFKSNDDCTIECQFLFKVDE